MCVGPQRNDSASNVVSRRSHPTLKPGNPGTVVAPAVTRLGYLYCLARFPGKAELAGGCSDCSAASQDHSTISQAPTLSLLTTLSTPHAAGTPYCRTACHSRTALTVSDICGAGSVWMLPGADPACNWRLAGRLSTRQCRAAQPPKHGRLFHHLGRNTARYSAAQQKHTETRETSNGYLMTFS